MLHRMIADFARWNITILATDINPESLHKAAMGKFRDWSFRGGDQSIKERYFTRDGEGNYNIVPVIRKMVTFAPLNLAEDSFPSMTNNTNAMDIIFCRNVLMYFAPDIVKKVIENFSRSLLPGGWLIVSPCEIAHTLYSQFETVSYKNAILFRKPAHGESTAAAPVFNPTDAGHIPFTPLYPPESIPVPFLDQPPAAPLSAPAAGQNPPSISPYDAAVNLYQKGQYSEAQSILSDMLTQSGADPENSSPGKAAILLARLYANMGEFAKALEWTEKSIVSDKLDPEVHYLEAIIFQEQGDLESAVAALKRTLYLDHSFVLAHFALANLLIQQAKVKEAKRYLRNAASLLPESGEDDILPGSEGLSARRLGEIIAARLASING
jgi:chemotaxis protein methyltransferase CheR